MDEGTTYVGMDVHKRTIAVSVRSPGGGRDERTWDVWSPNVWSTFTALQFEFAAPPPNPGALAHRAVAPGDKMSALSGKTTLRWL